MGKGISTSRAAPTSRASRSRPTSRPGTPCRAPTAALAATQPAHSFEVNWSGADTGSGVDGFNIFVSENGGPFTLWQNTAATSAVFYGRANTTYSFDGNFIQAEMVKAFIPSIEYRGRFGPT